ncbi:MAG: hypothetical protein LQ351_000544 [Letrouitia transgressa]|nr:MAG: hypothetical protein LQ351_000544 [Letrouitia transgressa]
MVKSYLKYEHSKTFGLIASSSSNTLWSADEEIAQNSASRKSGAGRALVGANEEVLCWDVKKGELLSRWRDKKCTAAVSVLARSKVDLDVYAVGYEDGSIRLWDSRLANIIITFNGHRSAVTSLAFDKSGERLASGAKDTDIIIWDLIAEVGLYRLRGHENQITGLQFLQFDATSDHEQANGTNMHPNGVLTNLDDHSGFLLTTSKDARIKIWNLGTQHCIETHVAQSSGECWSLGVSPDRSGCITAGNEGELKIWSIDMLGLGYAARQISDKPQKQYLQDRGFLYRQGKNRAIGVSFHPHGKYIAVHGAEKAVELWRIRSDAEVQKTLARKRKRRREKALISTNNDGLVNGEAGDDEKNESLASADITDVVVPYVIVRTGGKVTSIDWGQASSKSLHLLTANSNNELEMYNVPIGPNNKSFTAEMTPEYSRAFSVGMPGHRSDVRSLALSSDGRMLASASNGTMKIWNTRTQNCIRTLDCGYALCCSFLPGDKIVVIGNQSGEIEIFDIASSALIETVKAHDRPVWTLHVHPDGRSLATGSADKCAKFFDFEIVQEDISGSKESTPRLKLAHKRTLKVSDDVLSIRFSPDSRLIALSLLDNTVKVFFVDSLKLFLNLYGHKLPVLSMDISYDSKMIVTSSADKNVRLWGLDFGDCHKAFFAHQDSIMQVVFVPHNQDGNGHQFFSASKDRVIKYWDGDKFEQIQKLEGHHGEIWAMAIDRTGQLLVTASHDKSIRVWQQTDEQIFLEEEREKELEEMYENTLTTWLDQVEETPGEKAEVAPAGKATIETLMAGERVVEALEISIPDLIAMKEWSEAKAGQPHLAPPDRHPVLLYGNMSAEAHVLHVVQKIQAASLQDALLVLPFDKVISLFTFLQIWAEKQWNMPLTCRILFFLLKTHHRQIVASNTVRPLLDGIRQHLRYGLKSQKDEMGFNLAALRFLGTKIQEKGTKDYVDEALWEEEEKAERGRKKRTFVNVA